MISKEIQYLFDRGMFGMKFGLKNIQDLMEYTKTDYKELTVIHIAGTNGKGSVANIIAEVLRSNGYRTGLFTSPHIQRCNERIRIDNEEISDEDISDYIGFFKEGIEKFNCTFFEANTAIAVKYFLDKKTDIAVIETGLGGRLDSTNILNPMLSVVTGIDIDHQKQLGNSIVEIAREKAGIIKTGVPVVVNTDKRSVRRLFKRTAEKKNSRVVFTDKKKFSFKKDEPGLITDFHFNGVHLYPKADLRGSYQKENLRTALTALKVISGRIKLDPVKVGSALSSVRVKGRMQTVSKDPLVMIDAAHNMQGLRALKKELENPGRGKIHLIFGTVRDKDHEKIISMVSGFDARKYFTQADNKRALDVETLKNIKNLKIDIDTGFFKDPAEAYSEAVKNYCGGDMIVITGSHYLIGDMLDKINLKLN
ncbi:MAG TPA: folylpolyglutamate synthase/dihydrofolate synthase family protein [Clostridiales bacterium]|nr:folylpolyglutamate synthase/dihydrofolate synthase family protein [Clostridiales bacterium]